MTNKEIKKIVEALRKAEQEIEESFNKAINKISKLTYDIQNNKKSSNE